MHHLDVKTMFLNNCLHNKVCMQQPLRYKSLKIKHLIFNCNGKAILLVLYVDDLFPTVDDKSTIDKLKQELHQKNSLTNMMACCSIKPTMQQQPVKNLLCNLFHEFGFVKPRLIDLLCDNQSSIEISHNPLYHSKTKHFKIHLYYIQDVVEKKNKNIVKLLVLIRSRM
uniref:Reverse transcriptase Ty1/copia-type domain-containing protein n=1 Tax=Physcomitrium patens TaxID=3218 RepID=A0A2K1JSX8_PHYPA|nr:hypothetical protein PHYPA_014406 [Physcomitrium patens]